MGVYIILKKSLEDLFNTLPVVDVLTQGGNPAVAAFLATDDTIKEAKEKGFFALMPGFYRILGEIKYKKAIPAIFPFPTHSADVLYIPATLDKSLKIPINLGPLSNANAIYNECYQDEIDDIYESYLKDKDKYGEGGNFYKEAKDIFYSKLKEDRVIIGIKSLLVDRGNRICQWGAVA